MNQIRLQLVALLVALLLLVGCRGGPGGEKAAAEESADELVPVSVVALDRGPIEERLRLSSNVAAERQATVIAKAPGLVERVHVEVGDTVRRGALLLELEDDDQQLALGRVRNQLDRARREFERQQGLYRQNLISEQVFNQARYELDQARYALDEAQARLDQTRVTAPLSGTVTRRMVQVGHQVNVGTPLFEIIDFTSLVVPIFVPEAELPRLRVGLEARVETAALGDRQLSGRVQRIAPTVDPRSGTVEVVVALDPAPGLRPGMFAQVSLVIERHEQALRIPKRAIVYDGEQRFVYRLNGDSDVERLALEAGLEDADHVEALGTFAEGDRVIVAGHIGLRPGARVRVVEDDEAPQS